MRPLQGSRLTVGMGPVLSHDRDLVLGYRAGSPVLRAIDIEIRAGERLILWGPNGAGKSTYLRSFIQPSLILAGERQPGPAVDRCLYLPQRPLLSVEVPCRVSDFLLKSMVLTRGILARPRAGDLTLVDGALERVGLLPYRNCQLAELSGGQTQRLLLARALLSSWDLLILDEPFAAVDEAGREILWRCLDEVLESTAQLIVVHEEKDVVRGGGRILAVGEGTVHEIPSSQFASRSRERDLDVVISH